jgi:hypothetical protein
LQIPLLEEAVAVKVDELGYDRLQVLGAKALI